MDPRTPDRPPGTASRPLAGPLGRPERTSFDPKLPENIMDVDLSTC